LTDFASDMDMTAGAATRRPLSFVVTAELVARLG
jgi:hypothetical protein